MYIYYSVKSQPASPFVSKDCMRERERERMYSKWPDWWTLLSTLKYYTKEHFTDMIWLFPFSTSTPVDSFEASFVTLPPLHLFNSFSYFEDYMLNLNQSVSLLLLIRVQIVQFDGWRHDTLGQREQTRSHWTLLSCVRVSHPKLLTMFHIGNILLVLRCTPSSQRKISILSSGPASPPHLKNSLQNKLFLS